MNQTYNFALREYCYQLFLLSRKQPITKKDFKKQSEAIVNSVVKSFELNPKDKKEIKSKLLQVSLEQYYNDRETKIQK